MSKIEFEKQEILCVGEVLWDRLPTGAKPGGAPMNVALHLNAIGQKVTVVSSVGNDKAGDDLKLFLEKSGLETTFIQTDSELPTSEVLVQLDANKNATYEICEPVAWDNIHLSESLAQKAQQSGLLVYGSLASRNSKTRNTLLSLLNGNTINLIDVNFRKPYNQQTVVEQLMQQTHLAKLNDEELLTFASWHKQSAENEKDLVKWFSEYYQLQMVCVTKGEKGALLYADGQLFEHPGFKVKAVDTVGAGDAFLAGMIAALFEEKSWEQALAFACATGAFVASKAGATPKYDRREIENILNQGN
ncbi:carbohydrate kinase [uncultured Draconibacterium sp.]|uniref:carbohydrate kinase family protein n=1 Tax=uncultured Draconibacterium sp. TaxID=1573823 RepID=UPI0025F5CB9B|nr:carbohydrate kinase [uncultured Draconibacterium sp.]